MQSNELRLISGIQGDLAFENQLMQLSRLKEKTLSS